LDIAALMKKLISKRKYVNDNPHEFECPKSEALALKLLANIIYGTLGFQQSRLYTLRLAERIAQRGRDILSKTVEVVGLTHRDVSIIYGDTDSVMVCCDNSKDRAKVIAEEINAAHVSAIHLKYENTA
jgi:DNA polymerase alpha subunit A